MNQETLNAKKAVVEELVGHINEAGSTIVCEYRGLTVSQLETLRGLLRECEATFKVYKNSMVTRALKETGHEELVSVMEGPNAVIFCKDPLASAKVTAKFAKKNDSLKLKGGLVEGKFVDAKGVKELATIPGREGLISMFLSCLQAPVRQFAATVKAIADKNAN